MCSNEEDKTDYKYIRNDMYRKKCIKGKSRDDNDLIEFRHNKKTGAGIS